jgi:hypothetical protein
MSLVFPALSHASLGYTIRQDADLYRTEALEPPPLASLDAGQAVLMRQRGPAHSLVETADGVKGWIRNENLLAMVPVGPQEHRLSDQKVTGDELNISPLILDGAVDTRVTVEFERTFRGEISEMLDKEQVEMRHDEN